jgi:DNA polymerase-3 subunit gamma/tau
MFRALLREQEDLAWAPQPFAVLEMAVVRLATLAPGDDVARLLARLDALERRLGEPRGAGPGAGGAGSGGGSGARAGSERPAAPAEPRARRRRDAEAGPAARPAEPPAPPATPLVAAAPEAAVPAAPPEAVFDRLRALAAREPGGLYGALEGARIAERSAQGLRLRVPRRFSAQRLRDRIGPLEALCERCFGERVRVVIECEEELRESGASEAPRAEQEALRQLRQAALAHPGVNAALELLEGEVVEIRPLRPPPGDPPLAGTP